MRSRVTFGQSLRRSLLTAGVGTALFVSLLLGARGLVIDDSVATPAPVSEDGVGRVTRLLARHGCWTAAAPDGVIPTRAVVTLPGERAEVLPADVGFGIWLEGDPGQVHGFCP